ncbi:MAG: hypothetical protein RLZZ141_407 [Pseudomonadota bacterium]|jgi:Flp pilus assembly protein TadG
MIALPLFLLIFGILELAMVFWLSSLMDNAVNMAARKIRTGQITDPTSATAQAFKKEICDGVRLLAADCSSKLVVDVRTFGSLSAIDRSAPLVNGVLDPAATQFVPGGANDIVLVRAYYRWSAFTPGLTMALGDQRLITATTTFRNEPYGT